MDGWLLAGIVLIIVIILAFFAISRFGFVMPTAPEGKKLAVGLTGALTSDLKKVKISSPVTFILNLSNFASEDAYDITANLNITNWEISEPEKNIDRISKDGTYKLYWVSYAPEKKGTYTAIAEIFYKMKNEKEMKFRVYNESYLLTLSQEKRKAIEEKSALISSKGSENTSIEIIPSVQQPFIISKTVQEFPFIIKVVNVGNYEVYSPEESFPPVQEKKNLVKFSYSGNYLSCDVPNNSLIELVDNSKGIVCKLNLSGVSIKEYSDFTANFSANYSYFTKTSLSIEVFE